METNKRKRVGVIVFYVGMCLISFSALTYVFLKNWIVYWIMLISGILLALPIRCKIETGKYWSWLK